MQVNREFLDAFGSALCALLQEALPRISTDWWLRRVFDRLTFQQQRIVQSAGITSLDGLDAAALIRVFDQNWHEIASVRALPPIVRTWLKEAQTIRNRWAHAPARGLPPDEIYRDLDTMERLLTAVGADANTLDEMCREKTALLQTLSDAEPPPAGGPQVPNGDGVLRLGALVRSRAWPIVGVVGDRVTSAQALLRQFSGRCDRHGPRCATQAREN